MKNKPTTTQSHFFTLILGLFLTTQTACNNGVPHSKADGDDPVTSDSEQYDEYDDDTATGASEGEQSESTRRYYEDLKSQYENGTLTAAKMFHFIEKKAQNDPYIAALVTEDIEFYKQNINAQETLQDILRKEYSNDTKYSMTKMLYMMGLISIPNLLTEIHESQYIRKLDKRTILKRIFTSEGGYKLGIANLPNDLPILKAIKEQHFSEFYRAPASLLEKLSGN